MDKEYVKEVLEELFEDVSVDTCKDVHIKGEFLSIDGKLFIKSEFLIKNILSKGAKWGETLYKSIFGKVAENVDIADEVNGEYAYCVSVGYKDDYVILILDEYGNNKIEHDTDKPSKGKYVVKLVEKKVSLKTIENLGSSSEIFFDFEDVKILKNSSLVSKGKISIQGSKILLKVQQDIN